MLAKGTARLSVFTARLLLELATANGRVDWLRAAAVTARPPPPPLGSRLLFSLAIIPSIRACMH
jgi:hypothetical protein